MKLKFFICLFVVSFFFYSAVMASVVSIDKVEKESIENKSQQQVTDYLKLKMMRNIEDEATGYVCSILSISKDQKIFADVINIVSSLIQIKTQEKEVFSEDNEGFIEIKMSADVETDNVNFYIGKIKQNKNSRYKKEFEELRKEKLNLETRLRSVSKNEYEKNLFFYTKNQFLKYKQKEEEYNKIANQSRNNETDKQQQQSVEKTKVQQPIINEQKNIESLHLENDNIERAKLENKMRISNLENEAKFKMSTWSSANENSSSKAILEATNVKKDMADLLKKCSNLLVINKENLTKTFDEEISALKSINFSQNTPVKDQWETTDDFNKRLQEYEKTKEAFVVSSQKELQELTNKKEITIFQDEIENLQAIVSILHPFADRLKYFQSGINYDNKSNNDNKSNYNKSKKSIDKNKKDKNKVEVVSLGEVNADKHYFIINVSFLSENFPLKFDFSDIGMERAKLIYENKNQFELEPLFSIVEDADSKELKICLSSFNIKHDELYTSKNIEIEGVVVPFEEILEFQNYENKLKSVMEKKENVSLLNKVLDKKIREFTENINLQKFKSIINGLKKVKNIPDLEKMEKIDAYEKFINDLKILDGIIISVSASGYHTLGLKKDGTVIATGDNQYGQCNVKEWKNITKVSAGVLHSIGLQKDGTAVAIGDDSTRKCSVVGWDTLVSVSAGEHSSAGVTKDGTVMLTGGLSTQQALITNLRNVLDFSLAGKNHIVSLRKDGKVEGIGDNSFGQINVKNWTDIKSISVGDNHTVGLKEDGTVVAVGRNKESQCNVSGWQDIIEIAAGHGFTIGLKKDGTVVCTEQFGKFDFSNWTDIVSIAAGWDYVIGIKNDGTVISEGNNKYGQRDVLEWSIYLPSME